VGVFASMKSLFQDFRGSVRQGQSLNTKLPDDAFNADIKARIGNDFLGPGNRLYFEVQVKNRSPFAWPMRGACAVRLSYHWLDQSGKVVVFDGKKTSLPRVLNPNEAIGINCTVPIPKMFGSYILEFDLVQDNANWFKDKGSAVATISLVSSGELPKLQDYQTVWKSADLSKDYWSVIGPASKEQFEEVGDAYLQSLIPLGLTPDSSVLDVGCGTGSLAQSMTKFLSDQGIYCGTDIADEAIDFCRQKYSRGNFTFLRNHMTTIPIQNIEFDLIVFHSVFTHTYIEETVALLREAARLLKKSGKVIADFFFCILPTESLGTRSLVAMTDAQFSTLTARCGFKAEEVSESVWRFDDRVFRRVSCKLVSSHLGQWPVDSGSRFLYEKYPRN
jgi:ubiquinone/menaquinone biosynthesis C-methylase UbiE